ncbi:MAG: InlB B-repeat-containing protein, partial [Candidatus Natronoplasma sp.]
DNGSIEDPTSNVTTIEMLGNHSITAEFEIDTYTLTISSTAGGEVVAPGEGSFERDHGTIVDLEALADEGYHFVEWTGDIQTIGDPGSAQTTIEMLDNYSITAEFAIDSYTLTIDSTAGGSVIKPGEGSFERDHGTVVDLEAIAEEGYHFVEWTGDNGTIDDPNANLTSIEMLDDYTITAEFEIDTYTLTINSTEGGNVTVPGEETFEYDHGSVIDLEAVADEGYHFVEWIGDNGTIDDPNANLTSIEMLGDYMITAEFEINTYTLTIDSTEGGNVTVPGEGPYEREHGTTVDLEAVADPNYHFLRWSGDNDTIEDPESTTTTIEMLGDYTITAVFEEEMVEYYGLTVNIEGEGDVEIEPDQEEYEEGTEVTLTAVPAENWTFIEWTGDYEGETDEITVTMDSDKEITAHFLREANFEVEIISPEDGEEYFEGGEATINFTVTNLGDVEETQTVELDIYDENGSLVYEAQEEVTLGGGELAAEEVYEGQFIWNIEEGQLGDHNIVLSSEDDTDEVGVTILGISEPAHFDVEIIDFDEEVLEGEEVLVEYTVTNTGGEEATQEIVFEVQEETGSLIFFEDSLEVTLGAGDEHEGEFVWPTEEGDAGDYNLVIASDDDDEKASTTVLEEIIECELIVEVEGQGSVEVDPEQDEYEEGTEVTLSASPEDGWQFVEWTGDYEGEEDETTIEMDENKTITAVFEEEEDEEPVSILEGTYLIGLLGLIIAIILILLFLLLYKGKAPEVVVSAPEDKIENESGKTYTYDFNVRNQGKNEDTYELLAVSSNEDWEVSSPSEISLEEDTEETVLVEVTVPEFAEDGEFSEIKLTAISQADTDITDYDENKITYESKEETKPEEDLQECPVCKAEVPSDVEECPECGELLGESEETEEKVEGIFVDEEDTEEDTGEMGEEDEVDETDEEIDENPGEMGEEDEVDETDEEIDENPGVMGEEDEVDETDEEIDENPGVMGEEDEVDETDEEIDEDTREMGEEDEVDETDEEIDEDTREMGEEEITKDDVMEEFSNVRGLGSKKAEILYENGYRSIKDLKEASQEELQDIKGIGPALSEMIKESVEELEY